MQQLLYTPAKTIKEFIKTYRRGELLKDTARFWAKVDDSLGLDACWPWLGGRMGKGRLYGEFWFQGRMIYAHRFILIISGELVDGVDALHSCDNPPCCNPAHVFAGTHTDNMRDKMAKGRGNHLSCGRHPQARLTDIQVREIKKLIAVGEIHREIAADFGVSRSMISKIASGANWGNV